MKAYEVIAQRMDDRAINRTALARKIGMKSELLRRSVSGDRKLTADEFIVLCRELDLTLDDF